MTRNGFASSLTGRVRPWRRSLAAAVLVAGLMILVVAFSGRATRADLTLEVTPQPGTMAVFLAQARGYFAAEGLRVRLVTHRTGKQALATMLDGGSDYATCADTPFVRAYASGASAAVIARLGQATGLTHLIGRRDRDISASAASLVGRRVGITRGTNTDYVLHTSLMIQGVDPAVITLVDLPPELCGPALAKGDVDAVVTWQPFASQIATELGGNAVAVDLGSTERTMWLLIGRQGRRDPLVERALLRALVRASADLSADPLPQLPQVSALMGLEESTLKAELPTLRFRLSMNQALLLHLESQRRWLGLGGPEILTGLDPQALADVDPTSVTLIHPALVDQESAP